MTGFTSQEHKVSPCSVSVTFPFLPRAGNPREKSRALACRHVGMLAFSRLFSFRKSEANFFDAE